MKYSIVTNLGFQSPTVFKTKRDAEKEVKRMNAMMKFGNSTYKVVKLEATK